MRRWRAWLIRAVGMLRKSRHEADLSAELESHLLLHIDDNMRAGMTRPEARRAALIRLGGKEQIKEMHREQRGLPWLETTWLDLRFAARVLRKSPGFTAAIILTLALGIGATTAVFSLIEGILLRPLPFENAERLVLLGDHLGGRPGMSVTAREIATYSAATQAFSSLGGYTTASFELSDRAEPEQIGAARLNSEVFPALGVAPILGRVFTQQEEDARQPVAVIGYALWINHFHRDPHIAGRSIVLDRKPYSVIGVMPPAFEFPVESSRVDEPQLWVPLSLTAEELSEQHSGFWGYHMVARLKDGVTLAQAAHDADRVARQIMRDFPARLSAIQIEGDVRPLRETVVDEVRPVLRTLFLAVAVVLLIACVNVSSLLLVRAIRQRREYLLRLVMGADSGRIIRASLIEGLLLSAAGGVVGIAFASITIRFALRLLPDSLPRIDSVSIDLIVVGFALAVAVSCGVLCSLAPAFAAARGSLIEGLKEGVQGGSGPSHTWLRSVLVVSEVAIALVLTTAAGAFLRSLQRMQAIDPGFRAEHALVASFQLPLRQYPTDSAVANFNRALVDRLSRKPGVTAVAISNAVAASDFSPQSAFTIESVSANHWKLEFAAFITVYGDYFSAMGVPLIEGRTFTVHDDSSSPLVVIVNQSMARECWPDQSPIGKRMHAGSPRNPLPWATVIGVVADTKMPRDIPGIAQWYTPMNQPITLYGTGNAGNLSGPSSGYVTIRSAIDLPQMIQALRSTVAELDPLLALQNVQPVTEAISVIEAPRRFNTELITAFAAVALLLAITGIYSVMAFAISQRRQEIAIRVALGAQRTGVVKLVLVAAARLAAVGCGLGVLGSLAASRLLGAFLFEVSPTDPLIYGVCVVTMTFMALLASTLPAARAASADPLDALRHQ